MPRGIPEVPMMPDMDPQHRRFLQDMRQVLVQLQEAQSVPARPTNLAVTPQAFANLVTWTRSAGADYHEVLWNTTPTLAGAVIVPVGDAQQWTDNVGKNGIKRFYWVRAHKNSGPRSLETGPVAGTTLASGTAVNPPNLPPSGFYQGFNSRTGGLEPL